MNALLLTLALFGASPDDWFTPEPQTAKASEAAFNRFAASHQLPAAWETKVTYSSWWGDAYVHFPIEWSKLPPKIPTEVALKLAIKTFTGSVGVGYAMHVGGMHKTGATIVVYEPEAGGQVGRLVQYHIVSQSLDVEKAIMDVASSTRSDKTISLTGFMGVRGQDFYVYAVSVVPKAEK